MNTPTILAETDPAAETEEEWQSRVKHTVRKSKRNLHAEFEENNKDRIDKAIELMKDGASTHEVTRECKLSIMVVRRIRKQRVDMSTHPF